MSYTLEFLSEAADELLAATEYYEERLAGLGGRFRREAERACRAINRHPLLWQERRDGCRRVNLPGFPYYIVFFLRSERLLVAAIGHASRQPGYWRRRIQ